MAALDYTSIAPLPDDEPGEGCGYRRLCAAVLLTALRDLDGRCRMHEQQSWVFLQSEWCRELCLATGMRYDHVLEYATRPGRARIRTDAHGHLRG